MTIDACTVTIDWFHGGPVSIGAPIAFVTE
jgi:hypothetical protein